MRIGYWFDRIGKKFLGECAQDAACAAQTGPDPLSTVKRSLDVANAQTCVGLASLNGSSHPSPARHPRSDTGR